MLADCLVEVGRGSVCENVVDLRSDLLRNLLWAAKSLSDARWEGD